MAKKTGIEKLNVDKQTHVVSPVPRGFPGADKADSMVVSNPREVDSILRRVPYGRVVTLTEIRGYLAKNYVTDMACPVSTAIFINISAEASEEMHQMGEDDVTPYWRTLRPNGLLNPKYPGGVEAHRRKLEAEGFHIIQAKGGLRVENFEEFLFPLE